MEQGAQGSGSISRREPLLASAEESRSEASMVCNVAATGAETEPELDYWRRLWKPRLQMFLLFDLNSTAAVLSVTGWGMGGMWGV